MDGPTIGYLRVSTAEQVASGAGLEAQREAVATYSVRTGRTVDRWAVDEGVSGGTAPNRRPALADALAALRISGSGVLIVSKPDRLARRARDLLNLRDAAESEGWTLVAADGSVDMTTPHGRAMATVMGAFAELERDLIRARTREALAAKRAQGVRLGRPSRVPVEVKDRIAGMRAGGASLAAIADALTRDGVGTVGNGAARAGSRSRQGVRWYPSTVRAVLASIEIDRGSRT